LTYPTKKAELLGSEKEKIFPPRPNARLEGNGILLRGGGSEGWWGFAFNQLGGIILDRKTQKTLGRREGQYLKRREINNQQVRGFGETRRPHPACYPEMREIEVRGGGKDVVPNLTGGDRPRKVLRGT